MKSISTLSKLGSRSLLGLIILLVQSTGSAEPTPVLTPDQEKFVAQAMFGHAELSFVERWNLDYAGFPIESVADLGKRKSILDKQRALQSLLYLRSSIDTILTEHPNYVLLPVDQRLQVLRSAIEAAARVPTETASVKKYDAVIEITDARSKYLKPIARLTPKSSEPTGYQTGLLSRARGGIQRAARRTGEMIGAGANAVSFSAAVREYELDLSQFGAKKLLCSSAISQRQLKLLENNRAW